MTSTTDRPVYDIHNWPSSLWHPQLIVQSMTSTTDRPVYDIHNWPSSLWHPQLTVQSMTSTTDRPVYDIHNWPSSLWHPQLTVQFACLQSNSRSVAFVVTSVFVISDCRFVYGEMVACRQPVTRVLFGLLRADTRMASAGRRDYVIARDSVGRRHPGIWDDVTVRWRRENAADQSAEYRTKTWTRVYWRLGNLTVQHIYRSSHLPVNTILPVSTSTVRHSLPV